MDQMRDSRLYRLLVACSLIATIVLLPSHGVTAARNQHVMAGDDTAVAVMVELTAPPAAQVFAAQQRTTRNVAAATVAAQRQVTAITASQQALMAEAQQLGTPVLYSVQRVYNGIAVLANAGQIAALKQLVGVKAVHRLIPKLPDNATSVPFIGAPDLWLGSGVPGVRGEGMRVAVIDTGIDYLHVDFNGPGNGYAQNDTARIGDVPGYPNTRVVGGFDFVGDSYNADDQSMSHQPIPAPDPDPMDCYGHGTHVAGTLGGSGVTADGKTYTGSYQEPIAFDQLAIGPGVAPMADLYALKVFGCAGSTAVTDLALEWAVDPNLDGDFGDRMDVVNLSLGSPYGAPYDTTAVAADNAAAAGVIVVASAGNSGDSTLIVGTPSVSSRTISVAATQHHLAQSQSRQSGTDMVADFSSRGPRRVDAALKPDIAAPGVSIVSASARSGAGRATLSGTSMAAPHVAGAMALLRQLHPGWSVEELKALAMNTAMPLVRAADDLAAPVYSPTRIGAGRIDLPAATRTAVVAFGSGNPGSIGLSFGAPEVMAATQLIRDVTLVNKSPVPAAYEVSYSPIADLRGAEIQPPGVTITTAPGSTTAFTVALSIDPTQLQHVRTVPADQNRDRTRQWLNEESGDLFLWPTNAPFTATLSGAGAVPPVETTAQGSAEFLISPLAHAIQYTVTLNGIDAASVPTATLGLGRPGEISIPVHTLWSGGEVSGSTVTGSLPFDAVSERWLVSTALHVNLSTAQHPEGELRGQVTASAAVLHVPVFAAPRAVAAMHAAQPLLAFDTDALVQAIDLTGTGLRGSDPPTDVVSLVSAVELQLRSPNTRPEALIEGEQDFYDNADLKYVGVTSDLAAVPTKQLTDSTLFFGLATYAAWSTPNEVDFNIYIDVNGDQVNDYRLYNSDVVGYANRSVHTDAFVSVVENLRSGVKTIQGPLNNSAADRYDSGLLFGSVMVLPLRASALGLTGTHGTFAYYVETSSADISEEKDTIVDRTPMLRFDAANPTLDLTGEAASGVLRKDQPGLHIPVQLSVPAYAASATQGVLLLHHHNRTSEQAEVINVRFTWPYRVHLPVIGK